MFRTIIRFLAKVTGFPQLWLYIRPRFYYESSKEKNRFKNGGQIIIANHKSLVDYFTLAITFPFRKQRVLVSEALYQHRIPGLMSRAMGDICVHRERSDLSFMAEAEKTLQKKHCVTIFPSGKLSHSGDVDPFRPAVVYLALRTGAPIVPCYIDGQYNTFHRTRIVVGKKIYLRTYCSKPNPSIEEVRALCEMLRKKVMDLKHSLFLYRKFHTRDILYRKSWFFDLGKAVLWLPNKICFLSRFHYVGNASRKDRFIKDRGVIASKHYSFMDPPILSVHYFSRRVRIVIAEELYDSAPWLFRHLNCIKYRRISDSSDPRCFLEIINVLKGDGVVGLYPEGHISKDGTGNIHEGVAYFSLMTNSPIYIYWMMNPFKFFRINHIMIGETIYPDRLFTKEEMKQKETVGKLNAILTERISLINEAGKKYVRKAKK